MLTGMDRPPEPDYRATFGFVLTMLGGIVAGWLVLLALFLARS